ncbi:polyprenol phosphomannose-dependent alpha 1,6 mannosyltransferase MptB [Nocardioides panacisoli]|uniref:polyprenol phosphomannose-dependent alpha 1,6 mannosyltransferase MptB n=1 Tax=Nocardioides panacisoli TaxID=627624 RepID=UPI001C62DB1D|nr:polyprenol phosphomannose-dependent alpha 1,6 mannosyltransferase MptB [Nocardioides panacisoli]QYJ03824.1 polyprenol phosphomannose-dependent alpha 1,6 mannosyltransferase MptB [Nocardioides panacisoli]
MLLRGFTGSLLVLVGGLGVATLPPTAPLLAWETVTDVRNSELGRMTALTVVLVGLGLVASAWLALCRRVALADGDDRGAGLLLVRHAMVLWSAPLLLAPPLFSRDGWSYAAQGMLARVGISPYEHGPSALLPQGEAGLLLWHQYPIVQAVDPMWLDTAAPYGPLPIAAGALMAVETGNPWVLVVGHRCVALLGLLLLAWAVPRLASWGGVNPALASALVLVSPLMVANGVAGLHNDLLMVGLMAAALVTAVERGWAWGAVLGGAAAAVKLPGGLVCVGIALATLPVAASLTDRLRRFAAVAVVSVGTLVALGVVTGLGQGWFAALTVPGSISTPLSITSLLGGALDWLALQGGVGTEPATFLELLRTLGVLASLVVAAGVALRWRTGDRSASVAAVAAVVAAFVVLCPVVHLWYFLWLTPFLASLELSRTAMSALLAGSVVLGMVAPLDSSLHGAYEAIVLACMVLAVLLPVLLLTRRSRERIDRIASSRWLVVT